MQEGLHTIWFFFTCKDRQFYAFPMHSLPCSATPQHWPDTTVATTMRLCRWGIYNFLLPTLEISQNLPIVCNEKFGTRGLCPEVLGFRGGTQRTYYTAAPISFAAK